MKMIILKTVKKIMFVLEITSYVISVPIAIPMFMICEFFYSVNSYLNNKIKEIENAKRQ